MNLNSVKGHIASLAVFVAAAAIAPIAAFATVEPPSVIANDAILWLDAADLSSIVLDASGNVTNWKSRVGTNFAKPSTASGFKCPKYEELAFDVPTVDFGDVGSNKDMLVNSRPSNVRMAFLVVKIVNSANAYWIGDTSTEFYKRGANGTYSSSTYVTNMWNGYDQVNMTADTPDDTKFNIITMAMKSNCGVGSLTRDRSQAGRNGGRQLSELILFSRYLTNDEREAVVGYLEEKWVDKKVLECSLAVSRTDEAVEFSRDGGGTWSSSLDISSSLPVEVTIRAKNDMTAGCFFEWSGLPPDAVFSDNLHTAVTVLLRPSLKTISCRSIAPNETNRYIADADGDFEDEANWSLGHVPCAVDLVEIDNASDGTVTNTVTVSTPFTVKSLTVGGNGPGFVFLKLANGLSTNVVLQTATVNARGTILHKGPSDNLYHLNLEVGGNMTVNEGGWIDARGLGFGGNRGVTSTGEIGAGVSKGCHGGRGSAAAYCYGSVRNPVLPGMGGTNRGGKDYFALYRYGNGGGVVYLGVTGNLVVNGEITADAGEEHDQDQAGGSILLKCASLTGQGRIAANATRVFSTQGAGGGRIAIHQTAAQTLAFEGLLGASGGPEFARSYQYYRASIVESGYGHPTQLYFGASWGAGTIYVENAGDTPGRGSLIVKGCNANNSLQKSYTDISDLVSDSQEPFGEVIVTNGARVMIRSGCTLKVANRLDIRGGELVQEDETAGLEFVGNGDLKYFCSNSLYNVKCEVPGKKIYFGSTTTTKIPLLAGGSFIMKGSAESPISLLPADGASGWTLSVDADAAVDVSNVAVSNCNASAGKSILAIDSVNLGGNDYWAFSAAIVPGVTNTWTGASSSDWSDGSNWSLERAPQPTDVLVLPQGASATILSGTMSLNKLDIEEGAELVLSGGCDVTVTNGFSCLGSIVFFGKEILRLDCDGTFAPASVTPAASRLYLCGDGDQAVALGGNSFEKIVVRRPGGTLAMHGGFTANDFWCVATNAAQTVLFDAGTTHAVNRELCLVGLVGSERLLSVGAFGGSGSWLLKLGPKAVQCVTGVNLTGCDASSGETFVVGASSSGTGVNCDFAMSTALWIGANGTGSGTFEAAANWAPAVVPGTSSRVLFIADEGVSNSVSANAAVSIADLVMCSGDNAGMVLVSSSSTAMSGDMAICTNATLCLDAYNDSGTAPNVVGGSVLLAAGGTLTHTGPNTTTAHKLHLAVAGDMEVEECAKVNLDGKGCLYNYGPNGVSNIQNSDRAASHGGMGSAATCPPCYGSILAPFALGHGGGCHLTQATTDPLDGISKYVAADGGGACFITVAGTLTLNGEITADGTMEYDHGSAGGTVRLDVGTLAGSGLVSTAGGRIFSGGRYGGGGRVAVKQRVAGDLSAFTGTLSTTRRQSDWRGAPGTIFISNAGETDNEGVVRIEQSVGTATASRGTLFPMQADYVNAAGLLAAYKKVGLSVGTGASLIVTNEVLASGFKVRVRDLDVRASTSRVYLFGSKIEVMGSSHRNGRGWYDGSYAAAVAAGRVVLGEANGEPGEIVWRRPGLVVTFR